MWYKIAQAATVEYISHVLSVLLRDINRGDIGQIGLKVQQIASLLPDENTLNMAVQKAVTTIEQDYLGPEQMQVIDAIKQAFWETPSYQPETNQIQENQVDEVNQENNEELVPVGQEAGQL